MQRHVRLSLVVGLAMSACGYNSGVPDERPLWLAPQDANANANANANATANATDGRDSMTAAAEARTAAAAAARAASAFGPLVTRRDAAAPPQDDPAAYAGGALSFSAGATVDMGDVPLGPDFTLEAWINPASAAAAGEMEILSKDLSGDPVDQFRLGVLPTGELFFMANEHDGGHPLWTLEGGYLLRSPQALPRATWSHVAVTKDAAALALIVDGQRVATLALTATYSGGAHDFQVGARMPGASSAFVGAIDQVRVWSVARSPAGIGADAKRRIATSHAQYASLSDSWRFDEMDGTSATDDKGGRWGVIAGATWVTSTAF